MSTRAHAIYLKTNARHAALGALTQLVWARGTLRQHIQPIVLPDGLISSRPPIGATKVYVSFMI
jgi:hypothetical protein